MGCDKAIYVKSAEDFDQLYDRVITPLGSECDFGILLDDNGQLNREDSLVGTISDKLSSYTSSVRGVRYINSAGDQNNNKRVSSI